MRPQYCISHQLAFDLWRWKRATPSRFALPSQPSQSLSLPIGRDREQLGNWFASMGIRPPYSFLVEGQSRRHLTESRFQARLAGNLPIEGSYYRIVDVDVALSSFDLFIVSPELSFVQAANKLSPIETVGYGYEICGTYTRPECSRDKPRSFPALTTPDAIAAYAREIKGVHGAKTARWAAGKVLGDSASVKETEVAMMFTLPRRTNGLGMVLPELNHLIEVDRAGKSFVSQEKFYIDMYWPQYQVGLEIDTDKHHSGDNRRIMDARRRNTLKYYGYTILEGTQGDTGSALGMKGLAEQLYRHMGLKPKAGQFEIDPGTLALYDEIARLSVFP